MKKKLLVLNYEYPPLGGGASTATYNMLQRLKDKKNLDITFLTSSVGEYKEESVGDNIKIIKFDIGKEGDLLDQSNKNLLKYSGNALVWMFKHRKEYDLIHAFFGIPCGFLAMLTLKPYIVSLRGSDVPFYSEKYAKLDKYIFQHLSKLIWRKAKYVIANSDGLRQLAYDTYKKKEIGLVYNGVDIDVFKPGKRDNGFVVVSTSRLLERKGLDYLIKAFGKFSKKKNDVELRLYGDGSQREELEDLVQELGIEKKVKFFGETKREDMAKYISKGHVFALPSKNEGMSNSLLEAMASGLAVIATDVGGTKELVDEKNGFVVEKESVDDIYDALKKLYSKRDLLERMGKESRKRTEEMSWENMAEEYLSLYSNITNE